MKGGEVRGRDDHEGISVKPCQCDGSSDTRATNRRRWVNVQGGKDLRWHRKRELPLKLVFVNIMQELQKFDSTSYITQPPVPLAVLNAVTPKTIDTALLDEQADRVRFEGDAFAFSVSTQNARAVYDHADAMRSVGKTVIMVGIHVTVCPEEAMRHADAIVTGEAEMLWPTVCEDLNVMPFGCMPGM